MKATALVILLVTNLVFQLPNAILAFSDPLDEDPIVSLFEDGRIAFLGAISSIRECRTCSLGERDERQRSPTGRAKLLNTNFVPKINYTRNSRTN